MRATIMELFQPTVLGENRVANIFAGVLSCRKSNPEWTDRFVPKTQK